MAIIMYLLFINITKACKKILTEEKKKNMEFLYNFVVCKKWLTRTSKISFQQNTFRTVFHSQCSWFSHLFLENSYSANNPSGKVRSYSLSKSKIGQIWPSPCIYTTSFMVCNLHNNFFSHRTSLFWTKPEQKPTL